MLNVTVEQLVFTGSNIAIIKQEILLTMLYTYWLSYSVRIEKDVRYILLAK
jgi:hypothetical protein